MSETKSTTKDSSSRKGLTRGRAPDPEPRAATPITPAKRSHGDIDEIRDAETTDSGQIPASQSNVRSNDNREHQGNYGSDACREQQGSSGSDINREQSRPAKKKTKAKAKSKSGNGISASDAMLSANQQGVTVNEGQVIRVPTNREVKDKAPADVWDHSPWYASSGAVHESKAAFEAAWTENDEFLEKRDREAAKQIKLKGKSVNNNARSTKKTGVAMARTSHRAGNSPQESAERTMHQTSHEPAPPQQQGAVQKDSDNDTVMSIETPHAHQQAIPANAVFASTDKGKAAVYTPQESNHLALRCRPISSEGIIGRSNHGPYVDLTRDEDEIAAMGISYSQHDQEVRAIAQKARQPIDRLTNRQSANQPPSTSSRIATFESSLGNINRPIYPGTNTPQAGSFPKSGTGYVNTSAFRPPVAESSIRPTELIPPPVFIRSVKTPGMSYIFPNGPKAHGFDIFHGPGSPPEGRERWHDNYGRELDGPTPGVYLVNPRTGDIMKAVLAGRLIGVGQRPELSKENIIEIVRRDMNNVEPYIPISRQQTKSGCPALSIAQRGRQSDREHFPLGHHIKSEHQPHFNAHRVRQRDNENAPLGQQTNSEYQFLVNAQRVPQSRGDHASYGSAQRGPQSSIVSLTDAPKLGSAQYPPDGKLTKNTEAEWKKHERVRASKRQNQDCAISDSRIPRPSQQVQLTSDSGRTSPHHEGLSQGMSALQRGQSGQLGTYSHYVDERGQPSNFQEQASRPSKEQVQSHTTQGVSVPVLDQAPRHKRRQRIAEGNRIEQAELFRAPVPPQPAPSPSTTQAHHISMSNENMQAPAKGEAPFGKQTHIPSGLTGRFDQKLGLEDKMPNAQVQARPRRNSR